MDTSKRIIVATVLFLAFLIVWQIVYLKPQQEQMRQLADSTQVKSVQDTSKTGPTSDTTSAPAPDTAEITTAEKAESTMTELDTVSMVLAGPFYTVRLNGHGAITSFYMSKYHAELIPEGETLFSSPHDAYIQPAFELRDTFNLKDSSMTLVFSSRINDSLVAAKIYTFYPDSYIVKFRGPDTLFLCGIKPNEENEQDELRYTGLLVFKTKLKKYSPKKLKNGLSIDLEDAEWVGYRTKYFMFAIVPETGKLDDVNAKSDGKFDTKMTLTSHGGQTIATIYMGPLDYYILRKIGYGLWKAYDFGPSLIRPFAKLLLSILRFTYNHIVHNYGWAIVIFAILMKLIFFPLNIKNLRNMRKMQELKPKMDALKKLYKDDPQRMQREMMELYKKYGVNPFSGCFVILLQLPIFWAMFQVLKTYIDLRGAPWILWIQDLSTKDPYYILPILMGLASLGQALMQPTQDEQSRMMAIIMPIVFTFIFIALPSGVVLYWLTFNLLGILEQLWIRKTHH